MDVRLRTSTTLLLIAAIASNVSAQSPITTTYQYDALGNRIAATNLIRPTGTAASAFQPQRGIEGDRVIIFGRGFAAGSSAGIAVTFNGVTAPIVSVATTVITVTVPAGATTGPLAVTLPGGQPVVLGTFYEEGIILTPRLARIVGSQTAQFSATVYGTSNPAVTWEVRLLPGADPAAPRGTISAAGLYTPPAQPTELEYVIRATSVENATISATARVQVYSLVSAPPPLSLVLPAQGDAGGLGLNTVVANPMDISVVLPAPGDAGGLGLNTVVANPMDLSVVLPAPGDAGGLGLNTIIAMPPVSIRLDAP